MKRERILLITICLIGALTSAHAEPSVEWVDEDGDGFKEVRVTKESGVITEVAADMNKDQTMDLVIHHRKGLPFEAESDEDFDSRWDTWKFYDTKGKLAARRTDENKDGKFDRQISMVQGRLVVLKEYDANFDGKVDKRALSVWGENKRLNLQQYKSIKVEEDSNYDGIIDAYKDKDNPGVNLTGQPMDGRFTHPLQFDKDAQAASPDTQKSPDSQDSKPAKSGSSSTESSAVTQMEDLQELIRSNPS